MKNSIKGVGNNTKNNKAEWEDQKGAVPNPQPRDWGQGRRAWEEENKGNQGEP